jgi:hypothetical protein
MRFQPVMRIGRSKPLKYFLAYGGFLDSDLTQRRKGARRRNGLNLLLAVLGLTVWGAQAVSRPRSGLTVSALRLGLFAPLR